MEVYFIVNEQAGNGRGKKVWQKLESKIDFSFILYKTEYAKHAVTIVNELKANRSKPCLIIAIGGDGTLNEVITGALGSQHIIISAIKAGSGNDFARGYKVFKHTRELNAYVKQCQLQYCALDSGKVFSSEKTSHFVNNAGFGFDALVATTVNRSKIKATLNKIGLGRLAYVLLTIKLLFTFKTFKANAVIDSKQYTFENVWFIAVCNQPFFGGGMKISPHSRMDDGRLEVVVVQHLAPLKLLLLFLSVFTGKHEMIKEVSFYSASNMQLSFDHTVVSHVDGDLFSNVPSNVYINIDMEQEKWHLAN